ncbi:MAG TPA: hypothetical protein VFP89_11290 [Propionibacteriaceae bacterium]|nr:hypothetical protein [Propionibacteriaceae bacterium]
MPSMLSGQVDHVIGVDTHRDANVAAIVDAATGGVLDHFHCTTDALGYKRVLAFANTYATARRVWAIEGTGSFGSGLTTFLLENGEWCRGLCSKRCFRPRHADRKSAGKVP